ncbi:hypothetical protein [Nostoc sp. C117]|uniref:hypothetical protein n=1 Tax=Nostoc sp. C117 TaxID=3349875 RepID=UPI00370D3D9F
MADCFRPYLLIFQYSLYTKFILRYLQIQLGLIYSVGIWTFSEAKLQAAQIHQNTKPTLELTELVTKVNPESAKQYSEPRMLAFENSENRLSTIKNSLADGFDNAEGKKNFDNLELSKPFPYGFLIAAPENFNPNLELPPPTPPTLPTPPKPPKPPTPPKPPENSSPPQTSTEPRKPDVVLESIDTDYRYNADNFGQTNLFIEPTIQFRLRNGNKIFLKTGFNFFEQRGLESVTNIPLQVGWQGKIGEVMLQTAAGVDIFNRLPTAINLNAKVDVTISPPQTSSSGRLQSAVVLSGNLEQGPYKSNVRTLENQITAWRFGPDLYWQIDQNTSLFSSLRLGNYNDGNSDVQTFSRLERKFGQFSLAANLFSWSYAHDLERTSGYFSPPDFLVYNAEVAWEGDIITNFLRCRLSANLGRQRLKGEVDNANAYQTSCTVKLSPNVEADLGYTLSNLRNHNTGETTDGGNSFAGQLRVKF